MTKTATSTALATVDPKNYAILDADSNVAELVASNLAGESISEFDLDQVKVPTGGGTRWSLPTLSGDIESEEITGIIMHVGKRRQYWSSGEPTGAPPECHSRDMLKGIGKPGGDCEACPNNQFGSGKNGSGKACKETRSLFLIREKDQLPIVVNIPPGSLKNVKQYLMRLPAPYFQVITRLTLKTEKNGQGIKFSTVVPQMVTQLPGESVPRIRDFAGQLQKVFG